MAEHSQHPRGRAPRILLPLLAYLAVTVGVFLYADSRPDLEWKETMNKGRAVFRAVTQAEAGLERHACALTD